MLQLAEQGYFDVIIHGCNCHCAMGAGIAATIRKRFPQAYDADLATESGSRDKLGSFSYADVVISDHRFTIINAYTQYDHSGSAVLVDYDALAVVMGKIKQNFPGKRIGYPMIGAGLAGGDWTIIEKIIKEQLVGEDHTLVIYKP